VVQSGAHIQQAPGGTSTLSLHHHDSTDTSQVAQSGAHIQQAPGGTSTLSLHHHDSTDTSQVAQSGAHIQQAPGGTSTLSFYQDEVCEGWGQCTEPSNLPDFIYLSDRLPPPDDSFHVPTSQMISTASALEVEECLNQLMSNFQNSFASFCDSKSIYFPQTDGGTSSSLFHSLESTFSHLDNHFYSSIYLQSLLIDKSILAISLHDAPSTSSTTQSHLSLFKSLDLFHDLYLCSSTSSHLITFGNMLIDHHYHVNQNMKYHHSSLGLPTSPSFSSSSPSEDTNHWNLYSIRNIQHIFQQALLMSPRIDQFLKENQIQCSFQFTNRSPHGAAAVTAMEWRRQMGTGGVVGSSNRSQRKLFIHQSDDETGHRSTNHDLQQSPIHLISGLQYDHLYEMFTTHNLHNLAIDFNISLTSPFFHEIYSAQYLELFSLVTQRFLEITQLISLSRYVFQLMNQYKQQHSQQRRTRAITAAAQIRTPTEATKKHSQIFYRQIYRKFRYLRQLIQALSDFMTSQVEVTYYKLRSTLTRNLSCPRYGYEEMRRLLRQYTSDLLDNLFILPIPPSPQDPLHPNRNGESEGGSMIDMKTGEVRNKYFLICETVVNLFQSCRDCLWELFILLIDIQDDDMAPLNETFHKLKARILTIQRYSGKRRGLDDEDEEREREGWEEEEEGCDFHEDKIRNLLMYLESVAE
jgi:hypothetical protein